MPGSASVKVFGLKRCLLGNCWFFSVTSFNYNQNQNHSIEKVQNLEKRKKVNIQRLSLRFRLQQFFLRKICVEFFLRKFILICMVNRKPTETSVTEFCYKSVNGSLEERRNINMILFLIHELFRLPTTPK